jgi:pilus assembly protein Flp/PilA
MRTIGPAIRRLLARSDHGATMVEYALLVALIALVVIGAVTMLGTASSTKLDEAAQSLSAS